MILVTGATGFVGQTLCDDLSRRRLDYRAVSRLPRKGFQTIGTIDALADWSQALAGVETVIHLAARVHVMSETVADPLAAFRATNVAATINLARQAAAAGVRRFVFVSSIKVNGEATAKDRAYAAGDAPNPGDAYGLSKWEAEQALFALGRESGLDIVAVRPPLVYGPGVGANFASLMRWAKRGLPLPLRSVANKRSLVFVRNLSDFLILCTSHPDAANQIFLVSDDDDFSIGELLEKLSSGMGRRARLLPFPPAILDAAAQILGKGPAVQRVLGSLQVDIAQTREITGWSPPFSADDGLRQTAKAFFAQSASVR